MSSTAAVPFWRAAGMTYISYSNICANLVRNCLKEPHKSEAISREKVHFSLSKWVDGKPEKPSNYPLSLDISISCLSLLILIAALDLGFHYVLIHDVAHIDSFAVLSNLAFKCY
ncbi:hypothetical protein RJ640_008299 [Escallonia rubra]|uniref:ATP synthase subunit epsilon, mitochondrial n=1 Tax=Escallonia rubra TaxID=112253 RepID=A0AA88U3N7_9ASTE|nr:hypothetical protein RJ640_008299 [Escallonia rubra]